MTKAEWQGLPDLLRRARVMEIMGVPARTLEAMTVEIEDVRELERLPSRTLAAVRVRNKDGKLGRRLYVKRSLGVFVGWN